MPQEQRYSQTEIERTAITFSTLHNYIYLYGVQKFNIITDHKPLLSLYNNYKRDPPVHILQNKQQLQG